MSLARLAHVNFFAATLIVDVFTEQIKDDDDDDDDNVYVRVRLHNKRMYLKIGLRKMMFRRSSRDLHQVIRLEVDGKLIDVPPVEGIIILNILRPV